MAATVSRYGPVVALAIAAVLPMVVPNEYYLQILTQAYVLAISACGLNVIVGMAGQLSLAHAGFFGLGAYAVALLATKAGVAFWFALPAGIALSAWRQGLRSGRCACGAKDTTSQSSRLPSASSFTSSFRNGSRSRTATSASSAFQDPDRSWRCRLIRASRARIWRCSSWR